MSEVNKIEQLAQIIYSGQLSNIEVVQLIELSMDYLNAKTIPQYARQNNMSYNGVKKHRNIITINNVKFVIEND